jgi:hypothetical protein
MPAVLGFGTGLKAILTVHDYYDPAVKKYCKKINVLLGHIAGIL